MEKLKIGCRIDVNKIDKTRIYNGKKGRWYDFTVIETGGEYNDFVVVQDTTKEEREAGVNGTILGNGKYVKRQEQKAQEDPF